MVDLNYQKCSSCGSIKSVYEFSFRKDNGQYYKTCKQCARDGNARWRNKNIEHCRKKALAHYHTNKDRHKKSHKEWKKKNPDYYLNYMRIWRDKNREKLRKRQREYSRKKYNEDENYRIRMLLGGRMRRVLKQNKIYKQNTTFELLGCALQEFKNHIESQFTDSMSWEFFNNGEIHIDHIRPCCTFDLTSEAALRKCFHYTNLQPLWAIDNYRKAKKYA